MHNRPASSSNVTMMPWSVKGVSDEARAIAKAKAQENGTTIGAWLSETIIKAAADDADAPPPEKKPQQHRQQAVTPYQPVQPAIPEMLAELPHLVLALAKRVAAMERDTVDFAASFQDQLSDVRRKLHSVQQNHYTD